MKTACIYCRVSSESQMERNAANLPQQEKKCRHEAAKLGLSVLKVFTDPGQSARTTNRPALQEMLAYFRTHKGMATHCIVADLSRLARNAVDQGTLIAELKQHGVTLISCDEVIDDSAAGRLATNLLAAVNQFQSDALSDRVRYRMEEANKAGRHTHRAPLGYINARKDGVAQLVIDNENNRAVLVRQAFELVASGKYSKDSALRMINALGLRSRRGAALSKQSFRQMLINPIYAGYVRSRKRGERYEGTHEAVVPRELFNRVQNIMNGKTAGVKKKVVNEDFSLRRFVRCAKCNKRLTAGWSKGHGGRYGFYRCWNPKCRAVNVRMEELEKTFLRILGRMQPSKKYLEELPQIVRRYWQDNLDQIEETRRQLNTQLADQNNLNLRLIEAKVRGELSTEDFEMMKRSINVKVANINTQLKALETEHLTAEELIEQTRENFADLVGRWRKSSVTARQEIAWAIWPEGLVWSHEGHFVEPANTRLFAALMREVEEVMKDGRGERI